ncbi:MBL fold metallo-hydrolase [Sulfurimonas sp.]|uniref:MBL fold metallo-hydrolase n=1 Tax=Sulfurimonas sp. TaxID=2022749 RepID=UPI00356A2745
MKLTFLGTSAGKPTKERNVSALGLEVDQDNKWYLFDCGEATQHQLLYSHLSIAKLNTIFITHLHGDHYYGLPGLISSKKLDTCFKPLCIYGPVGIRAFLEAAVKISEESLGYKLDIVEFKSGDEFKFDKFSLKVLPLVHSIESFAFSIKEDDITNKIDEEKLRALGVKPSKLYGELKRGNSAQFEGKTLKPKEFMLGATLGRKIIIAGDNSEPDILGDYLQGIDLLVHECTYTQEVFDNLAIKILHTTAKDLGLVAQKRDVKHLIANHINPRFNKSANQDIDLIYDEIKQNYKGKLFIANDFDVYILNRDGLEKS